ncbi:MAG: hypothetical protein ACR2HN_03085 [Tepidiformaceae bacterium]
MTRAVVEADGSIRAPEELVRGAHLETGQELEVAVDEGVVTLSVPGDDLDAAFPGGIEQALAEVRAGRVTRQYGDEEFVAALKSRIGSRA